MSIMKDFVKPPGHEGRLVSFYRNKSPDNAGRLISEIMKWDYVRLERTHDYIQWLFPLPEESSFSNALVVDKDVFASFHSCPELQSNLRSSFVKMLDFYGFEFGDDLDKNVKSSNFNLQSKNWLVRIDHNHLRISRILRSLRVLGLESEAAAFYKVLSDVIYQKNVQVVSNQSAEFWRRAAERPVHWKPDLSEDVCHADKEWKKGLPFLRNYAKVMLARNLQQKHDAGKILKEQKDAEFQATKEHLTTLNAERKRKIGVANTDPSLPATNSSEDEFGIPKSQVHKKKAVVTDTDVLKSVESVKNGAAADETRLDEPKFDESKSEEPESKLNKPERIEQKASQIGGQPTTHIQQLQ